MQSGYMPSYFGPTRITAWSPGGLAWRSSRRDIPPKHWSPSTGPKR